MPTTTHGFSFQVIWSLQRKVKKWACFYSVGSQGSEKWECTAKLFGSVDITSLWGSSLYLFMLYFTYKDKTVKQAGTLSHKWSNTVQGTCNDKIKGVPCDGYGSFFEMELTTHLKPDFRCLNLLLALAHKPLAFNSGNDIV